MDFKRLTGKYYLITGIIAYLWAAIDSTIRTIVQASTLQPLGEFDIFYTAIDWFASCTYYFFIGALIGLGIDLYLSQKKKIPLWFYLTISLWIISSITAAIINSPNVSTIGVYLFPIAYSIFFVGYAFKMLFPERIVTSYLGKFFFDIAYLSVFAAWVYLSFKLKENSRVLKILLIIVFLILFLGFVGCAAELSRQVAV